MGQRSRGPSHRPTATDLLKYGGRRLRLEAWRNAQEQGLLAAANLLGAGETTTAIPWFWSDQYDLTLQIAGLADGAVIRIARRRLIA